MKTRPRLYVPIFLTDAATIVLESGQVHYLRDVLRLKEADSVTLFNAESGEWSADIVFFKKDKGECRVTRQLQMPPAPRPTKLVLAAALIKRDALDWLTEKASELGIDCLQPVITARTQSQHTNITRLQIIATEAAEQCDRLDRPLVQEPLALVRFLDQWPQGQPLLFAAESGDARPLALALPDLALTAQTGFLIGPEGGFTDEEHQLLRRYDFVMPVRMGPRLMRAETAAIALLAAYQALRGDWASS